jgi:hypothetical protein
MQTKSVNELIQELQQLRIRETAVIAEIREAIQAQDEAAQANDIELEDVVAGPPVDARELRPGDRVRIKNKIRRPATAGPSWSETRERSATVTRLTVDQVHIITDNGTRTWRARNNLRLI